MRPCALSLTGVRDFHSGLFQFPRNWDRPAQPSLLDLGVGAVGGLAVLRHLAQKGIHCNRLSGSLCVGFGKRTFLCCFTEDRELAVDFSVVLEKSQLQGACWGLMVRKLPPALSWPLSLSMSPLGPSVPEVPAPAPVHALGPGRTPAGLLPEPDSLSQPPASCLSPVLTDRGKFTHKLSDLRAEV